MAEVVRADPLDPGLLGEAHQHRSHRVVRHAAATSLDEQRSIQPSRPDEVSDHPDRLGTERQDANQAPLGGQLQEHRTAIEADVLALQRDEFGHPGTDVVQNRQDRDVSPGCRAHASGADEQGEALVGRQDATLGFDIELGDSEPRQAVLAGQASFSNQPEIARRVRTCVPADPGLNGRRSSPGSKR